MGRKVAEAYTEVEGTSVEAHIAARYGNATLRPEEYGEQVARLLSGPRHADGVAYGFRSGAPITPLDV